MENNQQPKKLFLAFSGKEIKQQQQVLEIEDGYECWNLKKFSRDTFIDALKAKIPAVNKNVEDRYYKTEDSQNINFGISEQQFNQCSWGLVIPDSREDVLIDSFSETLFLLNLYSPNFVHPIFYGSGLGIGQVRYPASPLSQILSESNASETFSTSQFVLFFKTLLPQSQYGPWVLDRIKNWDKEDWRLFTAGLLYRGLEDYENKKDLFGWQRESADMAGILECLFTAGDGSKDEVGYRLRKRVAVLLSFKFPSIETDVKQLYDQRSDFVHGRFFESLPKETKQAQSNLPIPDFVFLYRQKEYVRFAIVAYLYLAKNIESQPIEFGGYKRVIDVLEAMIINVTLRSKVINEVSKIFALVPAGQWQQTY